MAKRFNRSSGFGMFKSLGKCNSRRKNARKDHDVRDEFAKSQSPGSSEDMNEKLPSTIASDEYVDEEVVNEEPSIYDNLLKKLRTGRSSLLEGYKKREDSAGDSEEDGDDISDSFCMSSEEDDLKGNDIEGGSSIGDKAKKTRMNGFDVQPKDSESEGNNEAFNSSPSDDEASDVAAGDSEVYDPNQVREFEDCNGCSIVSASQSLSSFSLHVLHKLSKQEIDNLLRRKWKYRWEIPAFDTLSCKWMGTGECFLEDVNADSAYGLKLRLQKHWLDVYKASGGKDFHSSKQRLFFSLCNSYRDILHHNKKPFYCKGLEEDSSIMDAYLMHSLNHVFKSRDLVTKNDSKLAKNQENAEKEVLTSDSFLDQGFTRPKVLVLLPLASIALRIIKRLIQLTPSGSKVNVEYMDRFYNEYGAEVKENADENECVNNSLDFQNSITQKSVKPSDFETLFGANNNDCFMMGIKYTRKSIKLYSDFYSSDMIVASPLGLISIYDCFDADSIMDADNARFEHFVKKVFPKIKDTIQGGIMLFIPSYFDIVRIRNFLKSQKASFCLLGDYAVQKDISRARVCYFEGRRQIMVYTERAHFYHRYKIRGIWNLILYSLPERKVFYPEIVSMLDGSQKMSCTVLFSCFDQLQLERIVGSDAAKRMDGALLMHGGPPQAGKQNRANEYNIELGSRAAQMLLELEHENAVNYVLLYDMYASGGKWECVSKARSS
ncbi:hypothetical protein Nepgr_013766 [Nepenthes gracilis]|uniref:UTP25 NTP hydrolase-like domain-containing protein n=1 Tax=Nepenthes gracilis TaxID=150966 RepID=A0AAD3XPQ6_NEPGR|nr:hypothetical protein Nepgr_013766 [Nepenthes gracilis]